MNKYIWNTTHSTNEPNLYIDGKRRGVVCVAHNYVETLWFGILFCKHNIVTDTYLNIEDAQSALIIAYEERKANDNIQWS